MTLARIADIYVESVGVDTTKARVADVYTESAGYPTTKARVADVYIEVVRSRGVPLPLRGGQRDDDLGAWGSPRARTHSTSRQRSARAGGGSYW